MLAHERETTPASIAIHDRNRPWLHRFSFFTAVATLFLICSGGMVTSKGVGLAVPDWPTTFGYNMFLFPFSQWVGGIFFEHTHRLIASTVGFLTILLAVWLWRVENRIWLRNLGFAALGAVIVQGVLGGLRVTLLKDEIGVFHACLAQAFLGMLVIITLATSRVWPQLAGMVRYAVRAPGDESRNPPALRGTRARTFARLAICTTVLIYLQLTLGATMRHQHRDLAILDFPAAYGKIIPDLSSAELATINASREKWAMTDVTPFHIWLQLAHRFLALIIAAGVILTLSFSRRITNDLGLLARFSDIWFLLLASQLTLGAWVIWSNKAADMATAHVAVGATMFAVGITISAIALRVSRHHELSVLPNPRPVIEPLRAS